MPYIAFELDALNVAPAAARRAGLHEDAMIAGLLRLWAHCFRAKLDTLPTGVVVGFFGGDGDALTTALAEFGFLAGQGEAWRVRGADRYLRLSAARSKGGKAAVANLKQGSRLPGSSREPAGGVAGNQPELTPGCRPALTPSTEHLITTLSPGPTPTGDLLESLAAVYAERHNRRPRWGVAEARALEPVLADGPDEVLRRWRIALWWVGWPTCRTVKDLVQHWDRYVTPQEPRAAGTDPPKRNVMVAPPREGPPCALCGDPFETRVWEHPLCARHSAEAVEANPRSTEAVAAWIQKQREAA